MTEKEYYDQVDAEYSYVNELLNQLDSAYGDGYADGYKQAVDEFAEALYKKCDSVIESEWNNSVAPISWAKAYEDFKDDIYDIAEQMKGGV